MTIENYIPTSPVIGYFTNTAKGIPGSSTSDTVIAYLKGLLESQKGNLSLTVTNSICIAYTGTYIVVGKNTTPAEVDIIDPKTMSVVGTWTGAGGQNSCRAIAVNSVGDRVYAALNITPAQVVKIDISVPTAPVTELVWAGAAGQNSATSITIGTSGGYDNNIFVGLHLTPAQVVKISTLTMTTVSTWTGAAGQNNADSLSWEYNPNNRLIVGLNTTPAQVVKLDPSTPVTTLLTWTGAGGQNSCQAVCDDNIYYYAGLGTSPAQIVKINKTTLLTESTYISSANNCYSLYFDGFGNIYCGVSGFPKIEKVQVSDMSLLGIWAGDSDTGIVYGITSDHEYIFYVDSNSNLVRINIPNKNISVSSLSSSLSTIISQGNEWVTEYWQDAIESGIDIVKWNVTDPPSLLWITYSANDRVYIGSVCGASETGRIVLNNKWQSNAGLATPLTSMVYSLTMEWEMKLNTVANLDNTKTFLGFTPGKTDDRSTNGIIGFGFTGAGSTLQTVTDSGGVETTNTGFGETLTNWNKFKIVIIPGAVYFYLNEILIATHTTHLVNSMLYPLLTIVSDAGGATNPYIGHIRIGYQMR